MQVEIIEYLDHAECPGPWTTFDEAVEEQPRRVVLVGFVVAEDDERLVVTNAYQPDTDHLGRCEVIVKAGVVKRRTISP